MRVELVLRLLETEPRPIVADIKLKLANSTESELRSLQSSLQSQKDGVAVDLQRNVFKKSVLLSKSTINPC